MAVIVSNIIGPSAPAWGALSSVNLGTRRTNDLLPVKWYEVITAGTTGAVGPTGTGSSISDGSAVWKYLCDVDYTSDSAWKASLPASAVIAGNSYIGQRWMRSKNTGEVQDWVFTSADVVFSGTVTDSTHTVLLTAAAGESFVDRGDDLTNLRYDSSQGVGLRLTSGDFVDFITVSNDNLTLSRLQFKTEVGITFNRQVRYEGGNNGIVDQCLFDGNISDDSTSLGLLINNSPGSDTRNCLFINRSGSSTPGQNCIFLILNNSGNVDNCTFVCPSDAANVDIGTGLRIISGDSTVTNCNFFGLGRPIDIDGGTATVVNCVTDKANFGNTGGGGVISPSNSLTSKTYANQFINTTGANGDWRLKSGSDCIDSGISNTTGVPLSVDILNKSRPQINAWDVGVYEYSVAAAVGNLAGVEGSDTGSYLGKILVKGDLSRIEGSDLGNFSGGIIVKGNIIVTEGADSGSLVGNVKIQGSLNSIEGADGFNYLGLVLIKGNLLGTEGADLGNYIGSVNVRLGDFLGLEGSDLSNFIGVRIKRNSFAKARTKSAGLARKRF